MVADVEINVMQRMHSKMLMRKIMMTLELYHHPHYYYHSYQHLLFYGMLFS